MKLIWSPEALQDLKEVHAYIAKDSPSSAKKVVERIVALVARQLPENPNIGRPGRVPNTRELIISGTPFVVPYRTDSDHIDVLRVYHAARLWPNNF